MTLQILNAKFKIPRPSGKTKRLLRKRLMRVLDEAAEYKVVLISAPAGYGKTFALSQWAQSRSNKIAWISLDASDDDPVRLYYYLKNVFKRIGAALEDDGDFLSSYPLQSIKAGLTGMLNSLGDTPPVFFIVLDDYHYIQNEPARRILEFLILYLPATIHLILSTRLDPPLALDRMRVENLLFEIRADKLSFTFNETKRYLNGNLELELTDKVIAKLMAKTEGWIAGVHIAALLLKNRSDSTRVIDNYSGSHDHVMAYLVKEAYLTQPEHIQTFLLKTAILDHLSPGLCNAVTSATNAVSILKYLVANNLFIGQVDEPGNWYRYHNLFSEALRNLLRQYSPDLIPTLYHRAGCWYEQNGYPDQAIRYMGLAGDTLRAVSMIENYAAEAIKLGERFTAGTWLKQLPDDLIDQRPILGVLHAWTLMNDKTAAADQIFNHRLDRAEKTLLADKNDTLLESDSPHKCFSRPALMETIVLLKAIFAFERGMPSKLFVTKLRKATDRYNAEPNEFRCITLYLTGLIQLRSLDYDAALDAFDEAIPTAKLRGYYFFEVYTTYLKGWVLLQQGKYHQALHLCRSTLNVLNRLDNAKGYGATLAQALNIIIGAVYFEWHRLEDAQNFLERALAPLRKSTEVGIVAFGLIHLALVKIALNQNPSDVKSILTKLELLGRYHHLIVPLAEAIEMKLSMQLGNYPPGMEGKYNLAQLIKSTNNIISRELTYYQNLDWQLTGALITIQVYIKRSKAQPGGKMDSDAYDLIEQYLLRQLKIAEELGLDKLKIYILVTAAGLMEERNNSVAAMDALERALALAAPQEAVMPFIEQGPAIRNPLKKILAQKRYTTFISTILANLPPNVAQLIEPLSPREEEVLQLIAKGLSNQGISVSLEISPNTVKTHISSIYSKLSVNKRTQAVSRANELGIL